MQKQLKVCGLFLAFALTGLLVTTLLGIGQVNVSKDMKDKPQTEMLKGQVKSVAVLTFSISVRLDNENVIQTQIFPRGLENGLPRDAVGRLSTLVAGDSVQLFCDRSGFLIDAKVEK